MQQADYDNFAQTYADAFLSQNQKSITRYLAQFDFDLKAKKLLDLGCGEGYDLNQFGQMGAHLYGIDLSTQMINLAKKNVQFEADLQVSDFTAIPYKDDFFDLMVSKWAFQAMPDTQAIYKEVNRVLKSKGMFIFLASHPIYQFLEKRKHPKNYFQQEIVHVPLFDGKIIIHEPTHTLNDYLSPYFFKNFDLIAFEEGFEDGVEKIEGDIYPIYFIIKAIKK